MLEPALGIPLVAQQNHHLPPNPHHVARPQHGIQERKLGDDGASPGILELEREFGSRVCGVGGADDAAGPESAEGYGGRIDAVRGEDEEDVTFAPGPVGFEASAEGECGLEE